MSDSSVHKGIRHPLELGRYLTGFDFRRVPNYRFDVLVVGTGAAGSTAALAAAADGAEVALISKAKVQDSNTLWAQGGIAAVHGGDDSFEAHIADTLELGCGLGRAAVVETVIRGGPAAVADLLARGAHFDRNAAGELELSREGGHSFARVIHSQGDATGAEFMRTLGMSVRSDPRITIFEDTFVIDLVEGEVGQVGGVLALTDRGERVGFSAGAVILATGGAGQLYRETTNPVIATGDGVAMGFRAGAAVRDLEFVQFHPTCLYIAGAARVLISEIVRGHGGVLRDRNGEAFMQGYHPSADLAPRDVVSRAVAERMAATGDTNVYLDLSHVDSDPHKLFPGISEVCRFFGIDIAKDPVPVRPGAHYAIGGLETDLDGHTSVPGLYAVGECSSTGLHGANRMGSNSLLEGVVLGPRAGHAAAKRGAEVPRGKLLLGGNVRARRDAPLRVSVNLEDITYALKSLMWRQMGVERDAVGLEDALTSLHFWTKAVRSLAPDHPGAWQLLNMLTVAGLGALGARARTESRGTHFRRDFPEQDEAWRVHTRMEPECDGDELVGVRLIRSSVAETVAQ